MINMVIYPESPKHSVFLPHFFLLVIKFLTLSQVYKKMYSFHSSMISNQIFQAHSIQASLIISYTLLIIPDHDSVRSSIVQYETVFYNLLRRLEAQFYTALFAPTSVDPYPDPRIHFK